MRKIIRRHMHYLTDVDIFFNWNRKFRKKKTFFFNYSVPLEFLQLWSLFKKIKRVFIVDSYNKFFLKLYNPIVNFEYYSLFSFSSYKPIFLINYFYNNYDNPDVLSISYNNMITVMNIKLKKKLNTLDIIDSYFFFLKIIIYLNIYKILNLLIVKSIL